MNDRAQKARMPSRVLICGLGSIGRRHARILRQLWPDLELAALRSGYGPDCPELDLISQEFYDFDSALSWMPEAAIISNPAPFHQQSALLLARQAIPLLIEKPLGVGDEPREGWDELLAISQLLPILTGYVLRYDRCAQIIKETISLNHMGKLIEADFYCGSWLPDWRSPFDYKKSVSSRRSMGGGVLLELSHEIDLARFLLGDFNFQHSILRQSGLLDLDVEDQALLIAQGVDSSIFSFRLNFCTTPARRKVFIRFEKGEISWDLLSGKLTIHEVGVDPVTYKSDLTTEDRYKVQIAHFFDCIIGKDMPHCSLNEGLKVLSLVNQANMRMYS